MQSKRIGRASIFNSLQQKYIRNNYLSMSYKDIANALGFSERQIRGWVNNHCPRKNRVFNSDVFHKIDTSEKAYWLGYIYADGWISRHKRNHSDSADDFTYEFGMELHCGDRCVLEQLNHFLGGKHLIQDRTRKLVIANNQHESIVHTSTIRVYSKRLVEDLCRNGIDYNKTYSDRIIDIRQDLFPDFLRGYIDGDGCVCEQHDGRYIVVHITAFGTSMLEYIKEILLQSYGILSSIYSEGDRKHRLVVFNQDSVKALFDLIYYSDNIPYLDRKYKKFTSFYGLAA